MSWRLKRIPDTLPPYSVNGVGQFVALGVVRRRWPYVATGIVAGVLAGVGLAALLLFLASALDITHSLPSQSVTVIKGLAVTVIVLFAVFMVAAAGVWADRVARGSSRWQTVTIPPQLRALGDGKLGRLLDAAAAGDVSAGAALTANSSSLVEAALRYEAKDATDEVRAGAVASVVEVLDTPSLRSYP